MASAQPCNNSSTAIDNLIVDTSWFSLQDLLTILARRTYDVLRDDGVLRKNPGKFEYLRVAYPIRREPAAIRISLVNDNIGAGPVLQQLGYRIRTDHYVKISSATK